MDSGHARIYQYSSGSNSWSQGSDIDGEAKGDEFGYSVSLSSDGKIVAIGAPYHDGNGYVSNGHTRIYQYSSGSNSWSQLGSDIYGTIGEGGLGASVSLSADGGTAVIGSYFNRNNSGITSYFKLNSFTAPTISSSSPVDDATAVETTTNIVLNFQRLLMWKLAILLSEASDDSIVETIDVSSGQIIGTGSSQGTIDPSSDFEGENITCR